jgi:AcrR family transcriptional regulator
MSTPVKSQKVAQGQQTRSRLLVAARELFGARGYNDTSLDDIVAAAGVTKGALYHHFESKEDLFRALFEQVKRDVSEDVGTTFLQPDPWNALLSGSRAIVDAHLDPAVRRIVLIDARSVLGWEGVRQIEARYTAAVLRGALRRAIQSDVIERRPLRPLALMLNGALTEACMFVVDADDPTRARAEIDGLIIRLLEGLRPR